MIARRFSFPRICSPDCGYSSTKSSESNRSWASTSFFIIALMYCSTTVRLSAISFLPYACVAPDRHSGAAYALRLRADVLVQPEDVVRIVRSLECAEPVVLGVPVDPAHHVFALLDHIVHILAGPGEWLEPGHRRTAPRDVFVIPLRL